MWQSSNSNSTTFELQTFSTNLKFDECFKRLVVECEFVKKSLFHDWFHTQSARKCKQTFFLKFNLSHKLQLLNVQHNFCSVMCYIVLIWTLILLTLVNNIVTLLFNWPERGHYVPTDKINATIRIRIWRILKVKIRIHLHHITTKSAFNECEFWPALSHHYKI